MVQKLLQSGKGCQAPKQQGQIYFEGLTIYDNKDLHLSLIVLVIA